MLWIHKIRIILSFIFCIQCLVIIRSSFIWIMREQGGAKCFFLFFFLSLDCDLMWHMKWTFEAFESITDSQREIHEKHILLIYDSLLPLLLLLLLIISLCQKTFKTHIYNIFMFMSYYYHLIQQWKRKVMAIVLWQKATSCVYIRTDVHTYRI